MHFLRRRRIKMDKKDIINERLKAKQVYQNARIDPDIVKPEVFAQYMRALADYANVIDTEDGHDLMDCLMLILLSKLGYEEAADIFSDAEKWYA